MSSTYFNCHSHTHYSNLRLLDSINRPKDLIKTAIKLGLSGIAITDHECLSGHVEIEKIAQEIKAENPNFTIALGNEIYLVDERVPNQKYYHFILIAKDEIGHRALRELSSTAWYYSYTDRKQTRVPTLKTELIDIVNKYPGHLIATTACIGGELSSNALLYSKAEEAKDLDKAKEYYNNIVNFVDLCKKLFKDDFYIECAPTPDADQVRVNKKLSQIAKYFGVKMVVGTDAHYLVKEDREIHKAYLTSKQGDREVDGFYDYTYIMDAQEVQKWLSYSFDQNEIETILNNTLVLQKKITSYSLFHKQDIPRVDVPDYPISNQQTVLEAFGFNKYERIIKMFSDEDIQNRYWVNTCVNKLCELGKLNETYLDELEEEARVKSIISEKLETNMFRYPNTLQHYIDLMWDCGSTVGAGRGSSCAALNHYLMGITQLDPIEWNLPFFRYLNDERIELGCLILILPSCKKTV